MTEQAIMNWVTQLGAGDAPFTLFLAIILMSYLLEDVAIVAAAVLAANGSLSLPFAVLAVFVGIATGDLALYYLGAWSSHWRGFRYAILTHQSMRSVRRRLQRNTATNIFIIRFIPGLRTLGYALCGIFRVPPLRFLTAVLAATAVWTSVVFTLVYQLGSQAWIQASAYKWWLIPIAGLILIISNRTVKRRLQRRLKQPSFS